MLPEKRAVWEMIADMQQSFTPAVLKTKDTQTHRPPVCKEDIYFLH